MADFAFSWAVYGLGPDVQVGGGNISSASRRGLAALTGDRFMYLFDWTGQSFRPYRTEAGTTGNALSAGDVNRDRVDEVALSSPHLLTVFQWRQGSYRTFWQMSPLPAPLTGLAVGTVGSHQPGLLASTATGDIKAFFLDNTSRTLTVDVQGRTLVLLAVGDATNDGRQEVIASDGFNRVLLLAQIDRLLKLVWESDPQPGIVVAAAVGDWDRDRRNELIVGVDREILIFQWDGRKFVLEARFRVPERIKTICGIDIDRDGVAEIIIGTVTGRIFVIRPAFEAVTQFIVQQTVIVPPGLPDIDQVLKVIVTNVRVTRVDVIANKVIVAGVIELKILFSALPQQQVFVLPAAIAFSHFIDIPGIPPRARVSVDVEVEFADFFFNPARPREVTVVLTVRVTAFNFATRFGDTLASVARETKIPAEVLARINKLAGSAALRPGQKLYLPG